MQKSSTLLLFFLFFSQIVVAQNYDDISVERNYDELTEQWVSLSDEMKHYHGLGQFCNNEAYRDQVITVLQKIHHYDSLVLDIINDPTYMLDISQKDYKQTRKELDKIETDFSIKAFISVLRESCITRRELESEKDQLKLQLGVYSFDGQVLILETGISKYLNHLDKHLISMRDHIHKIHPDQIQSITNLAQSE